MTASAGRQVELKLDRLGSRKRIRIRIRIRMSATRYLLAHRKR